MGLIRDIISQNPNDHKDKIRFDTYFFYLKNTLNIQKQNSELREDLWFYNLKALDISKLSFVDIYYNEFGAKEMVELLSWSDLCWTEGSNAHFPPTLRKLGMAQMDFLSLSIFSSRSSISKDNLYTSRAIFTSAAFGRHFMILKPAETCSQPAGITWKR